jgi:hypothetical protein
MHEESFYEGSMNGSQTDPLSCLYSASQLPSSSLMLFPDHLGGNSFHLKQARTLKKDVKQLGFTD